MEIVIGEKRLKLNLLKRLVSVITPKARFDKAGSGPGSDYRGTMLLLPNVCDANSQLKPDTLGNTIKHGRANIDPWMTRQDVSIQRSDMASSDLM